MRRWFLSYHSPDTALAERLAAAIERRDVGSRVFLAAQEPARRRRIFTLKLATVRPGRRADPPQRHPVRHRRSPSWASDGGFRGPPVSVVFVSRNRGAVQLQIYCIRIVLIVYLFGPSRCYCPFRWDLVPSAR